MMHCYVDTSARKKEEERKYVDIIDNIMQWKPLQKGKLLNHCPNLCSEHDQYHQPT